MDNQPLLDATARLAFCAYPRILGGSPPDTPAMTLEGTAGLLEGLA
ncbi:MAG: hypothetical protein IPN92_07645 [Chromatiaceae bacterium]|nr:hypothetical protein [Chromatiaceae bacterium]